MRIWHCECSAGLCSWAWTPGIWTVECPAGSCAWTWTAAIWSRTAIATGTVITECQWVGGLGRPTDQVQSAILTLTSVISTVLRSGSGTRALWSQSWRVQLFPGLGGPVFALGPLRVGEWMRERVLEFSAVWPSRCASVSSASRPCGRRSLAVWPLESGRMASGVWPCGLWTLAAWRCLILHARLGLRCRGGRMVCNLPRTLPHTCP